MVITQEDVFALMWFAVYLVLNPFGRQRSWVVFNEGSCFQGKATATNEELAIVFEEHVSYDLDLPEFGYVLVILRSRGAEKLYNLYGTRAH